jgi:hypothetical protein
MDVVEVVLSWGVTVLAVKQVEAGGKLALGEAGELLLPREVLGEDRVEIVCFDGERALVSVPSVARLQIDGVDAADAADTVELERGHVAELTLGSFRIKLGLVPAERCKGAPALDDLRKSGAGFIAGSALFHAAAFVAVALFAPSLGAAEEDPFDPDRLALMQRMLDASAQREAEHPPEDAAASADGSTNAGQPARGAEGASGKPDTNKRGRWAAKGTARPEDATLAREHALSDAASDAATVGMNGVLSSLFATDANAPVVTWGTTQNGSDDVNKIGLLYGGTLDDARGAGGLGFSGQEQGGGGTANAIGIGGFGGLGHSGTCTGGGPCDGIGVGRGRPGGGHTPRFKAPRYATPTVNGRIDPEVIRRVVRLNDGRYRACYEAALRTNPEVQGRVTVKFLIDRTGAVGFAADGGSDIPDEGVRRCVVSSFLSLSFPAPENGAVSVVYPIVFSPE